MIQPFQIYHILLRHFGWQGWWPTTPPGSVQPIYHIDHQIHKKNLSESERFEISIGAILTQNTAWSNVEKALAQLNRNKIITPKKIVKTPFSKLAKMIRSSGYFRQKAKKLKIFSRYLIRNYQGKITPLLQKSPLQSYTELIHLYGMGPETVDSVLLYAGNHPVFVVDSYTKRIGNRIGLFHTENYSEIQNYFQKNLNQTHSQQPIVQIFNEFHALIVALGKNICRPKPLCTKCPLQKMCKMGRRSNLPS